MYDISPVMFYIGLVTYYIGLVIYYIGLVIQGVPSERQTTPPLLSTAYQSKGTMMSKSHHLSSNINKRLKPNLLRTVCCIEPECITGCSVYRTNILEAQKRFTSAFFVKVAVPMMGVFPYSCKLWVSSNQQQQQAATMKNVPNVYYHFKCIEHYIACRLNTQ